MAFASSFQYTSAIEDLVSHGYVVAAIEHTIEVFAVQFADGDVHIYSAKRIPPQFLPPPHATAEESEEKIEALYAHWAEVRAKDESFVLDKLVELNRTVAGASQFSGRLDLAHVAVMGHSRGGWSATIACRRDARFKACINEDGYADGEGLGDTAAPVPKGAVLYVEASPLALQGWIGLNVRHMTAGEWTQQWHEKVEREFETFPAGGYFVQLASPGLEHYSFSDELLLRAWKDGSKEKEASALNSLRLTEEIARTFLDEALKNKKIKLRDEPGVRVNYFPAEN
jgi:hypothetical protein